MSKERLEDIKERFVKYEYDYNLNGEDVEWLIEQAERVQELVETNKKNYWIASDFKFENLVLEQQNKRYREAIERALSESGWGDEGNALYRTIGILTKALEGEE